MLPLLLLLLFSLLLLLLFQVDLRAWLQWAEQSLAEAGPISRLPAGLATQREEQEERMEEVDRRYGWSS